MVRQVHQGRLVLLGHLGRQDLRDRRAVQMVRVCEVRVGRRDHLTKWELMLRKR